MRRDDGICAGKVEKQRRREEGQRRDKMKERRQRNSQNTVAIKPNGGEVQGGCMHYTAKKVKP